MKRWKVSALLLSVMSIFWTRNAYAYLDPGSGSYILQLIIAAGVACIFGIKMFFGQIKVFFKSLFSKKDKTKDDDKSA